MPAKRNLEDYAIILNEEDNVATALIDMPEGEYARLSCNAPAAVMLSEPIKAGFKIAIAHIRPGKAVYKYGHPIGLARVHIRPGDLVHVHNMASCYTLQGS